MKQKLLIILGIILALAVGIFVGTKIKKTNAPSGASNTYQSGWDAAMKAVGQPGSGPRIPDGVEVKNLNGKVDAVSGNAITLKVSTLGMIDTPELVTRTVTVNADTKIVQLVQKDPAQFQKEMESFQEKIKQGQGQQNANPQDLPAPPSFQDKKDANIGDIKVGQIILINANEDVRGKQQFVATEIQIQAVLATPSATVPSTQTNIPTPPAPVAQGAPSTTNVSVPPVPVAPASDQKNLPPVPPAPVK